jgi:hypothetical protein
MWPLVAAALVLAHPNAHKGVYEGVYEEANAAPRANEAPLRVATGANEEAAAPNRDGSVWITKDVVRYINDCFRTVHKSNEARMAFELAVRRRWRQIDARLSLACIAHGFWLAVVCGAVGAAWCTRRKTKRAAVGRVGDASSEQRLARA